MKNPELDYIRIIDTTLRDGEQAPGIYFSEKQKLIIAEMLDEAGVDELEVGSPAMGETERKDIRSIRNLNLSCRLVSWCRAKRSDIKKAMLCPTDGIHISFPVSPILLKAMEKNESWVMKVLKTLVLQAKQFFAFVSVGAQDAFRSDLHFLEKFLFHAVDCGADRARIADTVGTASPAQVARIIKMLIISGPENGIPLEFHGHNDLGMATANALASAEAGARELSVTVNGLGERAGSVPLEEIAMVLALHPTLSCNVDTGYLMKVCEYVAEVSGRKIPCSKPVTGSAVFSHESGIHCAGIIKDPKTYQLFLPEAVGQKQQDFILGKHSGAAVLQLMLKKAGIEPDKNQSETLVSHVKEYAQKKCAPLTVGELICLYRKISRSRSTKPPCSVAHNKA